jgi:hypothetical protein
MGVVGRSVVEMEAGLRIALYGQIAFAHVAPVGPGRGAELAANQIAHRLQPQFDRVGIQGNNRYRPRPVIFLASHHDGKPAGHEFLSQLHHVPAVVIPDQVRLFPAGRGLVAEGYGNLDGRFGRRGNRMHHDVLRVVAATPHAAGLNAHFESGGINPPVRPILALEGPALRQAAAEIIAEDQLARLLRRRAAGGDAAEQQGPRQDSAMIRLVHMFPDL